MGGGEFLGGPEPHFAFDESLAPSMDETPEEQPKPVDVALNPAGFTLSAGRPDNDHRAFDPHSQTFDF